MKSKAQIFAFGFWLLAIHLNSFCSGQNNTKTGSMSDVNIKTEVDPKYIYDYQGTKFVPPAGKTLLVMGQTVEAINEYMQSFPEKPVPGGWSAYWAISEFVGVTKPHKNTTQSTQNHQMLIDKFPNTALHSAMWMVGTWGVAKKTIAGNYDKVIKQYSKWAKKIDRPIYLRIGYEFDGPHNELEPKEYVKAYRHIVDLMRSQGVDNIAYVWHSYASKPYKDHALSNWYPGDEYVDWVGISVFYQPYSGDDLNPEGNAALDFAIAHKKPVMIAESNPIFGIEKDNMKVWDDWFTNFFTMTYKKNIRAICFINEDWTRLTIAGLDEWKDARLYNNKKVAAKWFNEINKDRYLKQSPELFQQLDYKTN